MNANYAEFWRVSNLEADFQLVFLLNLSEIFSILIWNINNLNSVKESKKNILLDKNLKKKSLYYRNCICQTNFWL